MCEYEEHKRKLFTISDKLDIDKGSMFFTDGEGGVVLLGPDGKKDVKLKYEGQERKRDNFLKMVCYLLNREMDLIAKKEQAELSDLLPTNNF